MRIEAATDDLDSRHAATQSQAGKTMKERSSWTAILAGSTSVLAVVLVGILTNLATRVGVESIDRLANIIGLVLGVLAVALGASYARQAKQTSYDVRKALSSAQRQADSIDVTASQSGVDPSLMYESVLQDLRLPAEIRFIYAWSRLERIMRSTSRTIRGDDLVGLPLGRLISEFAEILGLGSKDKDELRDLLQMRNALVHRAKGDSAPDRDIELAIERLIYYASRAESQS